MKNDLLQIRFRNHSLNKSESECDNVDGICSGNLILLFDLFFFLLENDSE